MHRFALISVSILAVMGLGKPALAADLDGPPYDESYYERPAPPAVVERRIIEHHYYEAAPERRAYYSPGYAYVDDYRWRRRAFLGERYRWWHRHRY
jgi:hypothetical protein